MAGNRKAGIACVVGVGEGKQAWEEVKQNIKQADAEKAWRTYAQKQLALLTVSIPTSTDEETMDYGHPTAGTHA